MAANDRLHNPTTDKLFETILALRSVEECYMFFEDLCTVKELGDMAQRLKAARMLLEGKTYGQIVRSVEISTAAISPIAANITHGAHAYALPHPVYT